MGQAQPSPSPKEFLKRNMALSRGTLEGQKSDEDFKGEVSAKKFSPAIIAWKKRNLLENFRNILFIFLFGHGERRWKMLGIQKCGSGHTSNIQYFFFLRLEVSQYVYIYTYIYIPLYTHNIVMAL